jgi:hypothetical protein
MGGVVEPLCLAKSHLASADARDLKKKTLETLSSHSTSAATLQWIVLPSSNAEEQLPSSEASTPTDAGLSASDVGGLPIPTLLASDDVILNSPLGGLRDGTILFMHQGTELKDAVAQWTTPEEGVEHGSRGVVGAGNRPLRRNPNWVGGGIAADGKKSGAFPRTGKEVGIKIRTHFDIVSPARDEGNSSVGSSVVAGGAVQAARLLQKTAAEEEEHQ